MAAKNQLRLKFFFIYSILTSYFYNLQAYFSSLQKQTIQLKRPILREISNLEPNHDSILNIF